MLYWSVMTIIFHNINIKTTMQFYSILCNCPVKVLDCLWLTTADICMHGWSMHCFSHCGLSDEHSQYWTLHESLCILPHILTYCCVWKIMTPGSSTPFCFCLDSTLKPQFWFRGLSLSSGFVVETRAEAESPLLLSGLQKTGTSVVIFFFYGPFTLWQRLCTSPTSWLSWPRCHITHTCLQFDLDKLDSYMQKLVKLNISFLLVLTHSHTS